MAVGSEYNISWLYIQGFSHKLMADAIASVYMFHAVFLSKCISNMKMPGVIHLAGRNQMIIDQNNLVRVPQLFESHLFETFQIQTE